MAEVFVKPLKKVVKIGTYESLEDAAFYHDLAAIQIEGIGAKTNYIYSQEAMKMMVEDSRVPEMLHSKYAFPE